LLEAVKLHLGDALAVHRGRTSLRDSDNVDAQLGLTREAQAANPDRPVDGKLPSSIRKQAEAEPSDD
jgi:formyltetrahydrofolate deformylase